MRKRTSTTVENSNVELDVAIIGAGPAGLYTAWRLAQQDNTLRICLFDAADRPGGRLASVHVPGVPFVADIGGMRYLPSQLLIASLIEYLELATTEFDFPTAYYLLRGQRLTVSDFQRPTQSTPPLPGHARPPYQVADNEQNLDPFGLIALAIRRALRKLGFEPKVYRSTEAKGLSVKRLIERLRSLCDQDQPLNAISPPEWRLIKRYGTLDEEPLYTIGFWDLLHRHLSEEGYHLAHDGSGYQSIFSMWNAAEAILWFLADFSSSTYRTITGGMDILTQRLYEQFQTFATSGNPGIRPSDVCKFNWNLEAITAKTTRSQKRFRLDFVLGRFTDESVLTYESVWARKVVLALPQPSLKNLRITGLQVEDDDDAGARRRFHILLDSVTPNPLFKLFLVYEQQWWDGPPGKPTESFKVITDQPLRQIYHFGVERQYPASENATSLRLLMASYSDARFAEYWKQLNDDEDNRFFREEFRESLEPKDRRVFDEILARYGASEFVMRRATEQLARVHNKDLSQLPDPYVALFMHWSDWPYYVGWHSWKMRVRPWRVSKKLVQPFQHADVFTCGEAFSSEQGWIEGALKSSERVLDKLGLAVPNWVNATEYSKQKKLWL